MARLSLFWQLFLSYGLLVVVALGALGAVVGGRVEQFALPRVRDELRTTALLVQEAVRDRPAADIGARLHGLHDKIGARVTLIAADGTVVFETDRAAAELDNHAHR